ncbi:mucin-4 [Xyrauchen texanus]|uniref:mucin-4 n=1 Tax=Xyrauchen texanus TaxID=154827 RepID=UPI0022423872|nr:mucin-4 [Xyrauchen texanus]
MLISVVFLLILIPAPSLQDTNSEKKKSTTNTTDPIVPKSVTTLLNIKMKNQTHPISTKTNSVNQAKLTEVGVQKPVVSLKGALRDKKNSTIKSTTHTGSLKPVTMSLNTKMKKQTHISSPKTTIVNETLPSTTKPAVDGVQKHVPSRQDTISKKKNSTTKSAVNMINLDSSKQVTTSLPNKKTKQTQTAFSKTSSVNHTLSSSTKPAVDDVQKPVTSLQDTLSKKKNITSKSTASTINLDVSKPVTTLLNTQMKNQTQSFSSKTNSVNQTLPSSKKIIQDNVLKPVTSLQPTLSKKKTTTKSTASTTIIDGSKPVTTLLNTIMKNQTHPTSSKMSGVDQTLPSSTKPAVDDVLKPVPSLQPTLKKKNTTTKSTASTINHDISKPVTTLLNTNMKNQTKSFSSKTSNVNHTLPSSTKPAVDDVQKPVPSLQPILSKNNTTTESTASTINHDVSKPVTTLLNTQIKKQIKPSSSKTSSVNQTLSSSTKFAVDEVQNPVTSLQPTLSRKNNTATKSPARTPNHDVSKIVTTILNTQMKNQTKSSSSKTSSVNQTLPSSTKPAVDDVQKPVTSLQDTLSKKKNITSKSTASTINLDVSKPVTSLLNTDMKNQTKSSSSKTTNVNQALPSSTKPAVDNVQKTMPSLQPTLIKKKNTTTKSTASTIILDVAKLLTTLLNTDMNNQTHPTSSKISDINPSLPTVKPAVDVVQKPLKDKTAAISPIKVVITEGCVQKKHQTDAVNETKAQETKLNLKPGFPLVVTHNINLEPGACTEGCETEMAALRDRVELLEKEMSTLKKMSADKKVQVSVETVTMKISYKNNTAQPEQSVKTKPDKTIFGKNTDSKEQKKDKPSVTIGQALLKHKGEKLQKLTANGKTTVVKLSLDKQSGVDLKLKTNKNKESTDKSSSKKHNSKDQSVYQNVTKKIEKTVSGTSKVLLSLGTKGTSNVTSSRRKSLVKTAGDQGKVSKTDVGSTEKEKKLNVNVTTTLKVEKRSDKHVNETSIESKAPTKHFNTTRSRLVIGSVDVHNITSTGFIMSWEAPLDNFKNFTVTRREIWAGNDVQEHSNKNRDGAVKVGDKGPAAGNVTEDQRPGPNRTFNSVHSSKLDGRSVKKFLQVLAGTVRSYHFKGLQPQTRYSVSLYGSGFGTRSKIHHLTISTGPEPPTDLMFSNITETTLSVSWTKPKSIFTKFKVTYTNTENGESGSMFVDSQLSHVLLSKLSAGSTYDITVISVIESVESDPITASVTTVPDSPTELKALIITDTKALLVWKPSRAKVDSYILSYGTTKSPNVTVTVTLSGSTVEHHLRGLQRSSLYIVKITSQVNRLQSSAVSTTFTTGSGVKLQVVTPNELTFHSAVISWKATRVPFKSYRLTYQLRDVVKEVILNPYVTQFELTGLAAFSNYTVNIDGERDGQYISFVSAEFTTAPLPYQYPTDCSEVQMNGMKDSGKAEIYPEGKDGEPVWVYCDMETDGGGWTVFQRRMDGSTDFFRSWRDYSKGFGLLSGEFWLGNDILHSLTSLAPMSLRIDLSSGNDTAYAYYANFNISSEANHYSLELSEYSGTAGDSMRYHNGRPFSTKDKDPNTLSIHCAKAYFGGWWYKNCYKANLNGLYAAFSNNKGVVWIDWKGKDASIPFTEMKLRPSYLSQLAPTTPTTQG